MSALPTAYSFSAETGEYVGASDVERDPLDQERYLVPAFATLTVPPAISTGQAAVFDGSVWSIVVDKRGETWWRADGTPLVIQRLGDPLDDGLLSERPAIPSEPASLPNLTARQFRLGLVLNGLSPAAVEASLDAIEDQQQRDIAKIEWEYATQFERSHPLIAEVAAGFGLTTAQVDAMWEAATGL